MLQFLRLFVGLVDEMAKKVSHSKIYYVKIVKDHWLGRLTDFIHRPWALRAYRRTNVHENSTAIIHNTVNASGEIEWGKKQVQFCLQIWKPSLENANKYPKTIRFQFHLIQRVRFDYKQTIEMVQYITNLNGWKSAVARSWRWEEEEEEVGIKRRQPHTEKKRKETACILKLSL